MPNSDRRDTDPTEKVRSDRLSRQPSCDSSLEAQAGQSRETLQSVDLPVPEIPAISRVTDQPQRKKTPDRDRGSGTARPRVTDNPDPEVFVVSTVDDTDPPQDTTSDLAAISVFSSPAGSKKASAAGVTSAARDGRSARGKRKKKSDTELMVAYVALGLFAVVAVAGLAYMLAGGDNTDTSGGQDESSDAYEYSDYGNADQSRPVRVHRESADLERRRNVRRAYAKQQGGDFMDDPADATQDATASGGEPAPGAASDPGPPAAATAEGGDGDNGSDGTDELKR